MKHIDKVIEYNIGDISDIIAAMHYISDLKINHFHEAMVKIAVDRRIKEDQKLYDEEISTLK